MKFQSIVMASVLCLLPPLCAQATPVFPLQQTLKQCPVHHTGNPLDLAFMGSGYFMVSNGKKEAPIVYTRYGQFALDKMGRIVDINSGYYLLGLSAKSDSKKLRKIRIPKTPLEPKATTKVYLAVNVPANSKIGEEYKINVSIYDTIANDYATEVRLRKMATDEWNAEVLTSDQVVIGKGKLLFDKAGNISSEKGLEHLSYPNSEGKTDVDFSFGDSTQQESPFNIFHTYQNGHGSGSLTGLEVNCRGAVELSYSNGEWIKHQTILVANFSNPKFLEKIPHSFLYRPTEKSGQPVIDWDNEVSGCVIESGYLEESSCLKTSK